MELSDLKRLADAFEKSNWDEVHFVSKGVEIRLSTKDGVPAPSVASPAASPAAPAAAAPVAGAPSAAAPDAGASSVSPDDVADSVAPGVDPGVGLPVCSATPGIFYRAPAPDAPPFVQVGDRVAPDSPIGIVEVMKLMNRVTAGVSGVVSAIVAGNGEQVEQGAILIRVIEDG